MSAELWVKREQCEHYDTCSPARHRDNWERLDPERVLPSFAHAVAGDEAVWVNVATVQDVLDVLDGWEVVKDDTHRGTLVSSRWIGYRAWVLKMDADVDASRFARFRLVPVPIEGQA